MHHLFAVTEKFNLFFLLFKGDTENQEKEREEEEDEEPSEVITRSKKRKAPASDIDDEIEKRKKVVDTILQKIDTDDNNPNMKFGHLVASFLDDIGDVGLVEMAKTKIRMTMNEVSNIKCQRDLYSQQRQYTDSPMTSTPSMYDESSGSTYAQL